MSETSDSMMNGELCQCCGVYIGQDVGYPLNCASCSTEEIKPAKAEPVKPKVKCSVCGKKVSHLGLKQHMEAVHKKSEYSEKVKDCIWRFVSYSPITDTYKINLNGKVMMSKDCVEWVEVK